MEDEKKFIIHGRVQGVGFRNSVFNFVHSQQLHLKGYVKNLPGGTVEVVAIGRSEELELLEEFCHKGPLLAKVTKVEVFPYHGDFAGEDFTVQFDDD